MFRTYKSMMLPTIRVWQIQMLHLESVSHNTYRIWGLLIEKIFRFLCPLRALKLGFIFIKYSVFCIVFVFWILSFLVIGEPITARFEPWFYGICAWWVDHRAEVIIFQIVPTKTVTSFMSKRASVLFNVLIPRFAIGRIKRGIKLDYKDFPVKRMNRALTKVVFCQILVKNAQLRYFFVFFFLQHSCQKH